MLALSTNLQRRRSRVGAMLPTALSRTAGIAHLARVERHAFGHARGRRRTASRRPAARGALRLRSRRPWRARAERRVRPGSPRCVSQQPLDLQRDPRGRSCGRQSSGRSHGCADRWAGASRTVASRKPITPSAKNRCDASPACGDPTAPPIAHAADLLQRAADAGGVARELNRRRIGEVFTLATHGALQQLAEERADVADDRHRERDERGSRARRRHCLPVARRAARDRIVCRPM